MLVLSRKESEGLLLNNDIRIRVLEIRGRTIRLGIEAPRSVVVRRFEIVGKEAASGSRCRQIAGLGRRS